AAPSYEKLIPRYHLYYCQLNVLRSALAVKLYQRGARRLPESLGQLVPAYLDAVPQDSFNKFTPLSYVKAGRKFSVYSFGPDGKDGGGAAALDHDAYFEDPARAAGDITFAD
ncbi:MAG: type II secretion system protein GspG, partial [Elusimicrobiota bacterium]|nr:type II secretion system protein GspG [Elusimicrobiota bacterium]